METSEDSPTKETTSCLEFGSVYSSLIKVRYTMTVRIRSGMLELAMEQEDECVFWRQCFQNEFIKEVTHKIGKPMGVDEIYELFEEGLDTDAGNNAISFDWLSQMDLVFMASDSKSDTRLEDDKEQDRILVLIVKYAEGNKKSIPFPLKRDRNPPADLFRNTIKRLRKYISFLKTDKDSRRSEDNLFITGMKDDAPTTEFNNDLDLITQENEELKKRLEKLILENERLRNNTGAVQFDQLIQEKKKLKKEVILLRERADDLELECAAYYSLKKDLKKKENELQELRSILKEYQKGVAKHRAARPQANNSTKPKVLATVASKMHVRQNPKASVPKLSNTRQKQSSVKVFKPFDNHKKEVVPGTSIYP